MTAKGGGAGPSMTGGRGSRALKVRVRSGKGRTLASKLWLERQLNDPYVARAKREGMRSRAAFKLAEIDDRFHLFKPGSKVVDLGAAPGGWSQVAAQRTLAADGRGKVVAIDLLDMPPLPGVAFLNLDFLDPAAPERLEALLSGPADVVMSDMAANATGHRKTDTCGSWRSPRPRRCLPARCSSRAGRFSARCCKGAPKARCSPISSATSPP